MSDEFIRLDDALSQTDKGATTPQTIRLDEASKIPVTVPSHAVIDTPVDQSTAQVSQLPFYPTANPEDPIASPIPQTEILKQQPTAGDQILYPVTRSYSATLEKPAWAALQLGFSALAARYEFDSNLYNHDQLASGMRDNVQGWLNKAVDFYSHPEVTAPATASAARVGAALDAAAYKRNFLVGVMGTTAEAGTDLLAMLLPVGAEAKFAQGAKLATEGPAMKEFAKSTAKLSGYAFVRTGGSLTNRGESALAMTSYSLTPYIAQATGLTGLSVKAVNAALNVFVSSPTYAAEFQATGGMTREFASLFIPKFIFDVGFAVFLKGLPEAEAKARVNRYIKAQVKEMKLPAAEAEALIENLQAVVFAKEQPKSTPSEAGAANPEVAQLEKQRDNLMRREVAILNEKTSGVTLGDSFTLPEALSKSKPKYGYKDGLYDISFASDFDKAAYIIAANTRSKSHDAFLEAFKKAGVSEAEAKAHGLSVRAAIKTMALMKYNEGNLEGTLNLDQQTGIPDKPGKVRADRSLELAQVRKQKQSIEWKIDKLEKAAKKEETKTAAEPVKAKEQPAEAKPIVSEADFAKNIELKAKGKKGKLGKKLAETADSMSAWFEDKLTPISSQLGRINERLKAALVSFEYGIHKQIFKDNESVKPFQTAFKSMPENDRSSFDLALKNGDVVNINKMVTKYDMQDAYDAWLKVHDAIAKRARNVGLEFDDVENHFPRVVKDITGFLKDLRGSENWTLFDEAIRAKQKELGVKLTDEEQAAFINSLIKKKQEGEIKLALPAALKERGIKVLSPELNQFYYDSNTAMSRYITSMNNAIAIREFFGKASEGDSAMNNINGSIGKLTLDLLQNGEISGEQAKSLSTLLETRFNERGPGQFVGLVKNLAYIDILGNPVSALTQINDVAMSLHKNGYFKTGKSILKSLTGQQQIGLSDIYINNQAHEFSDSRQSAQLVAKVFEMTGFKYTDAFGKVTFINSAFDRLQSEAKNPTPAFADHLSNIFGSEAESVAADLQAGRVSENVKLLLASELAGVQPLSISEMPPAYARGGDNRVFYMLKSYTLKQLDVARRDIIDTYKTDPVLATKNLVSLTFALGLMKVGADQIKDFLLGREFNLQDSAVEGVFQVTSFNRYLAGKILEEGPVRAMGESILPPLRIVDSAFKDVKKSIVDGFNPSEWESIRSIPIGGELYYWWVGGGRNKIEEKRRRAMGANPAP